MRLSVWKGEMIVSLYIPEVNLPSEGDFELWIAVKKDGTFSYNLSGAWHDGEGKVTQVPRHYGLIDHNALKIAVMNGDCETRIDFLKHTMDCINKAVDVIPSDMPTYEVEGE